MELENIALSVPGTIVNRIYARDSELMRISFCEDGFTDERGIPYVMEGVVEIKKHPQDRILVSYDAEGFRLIEPINGENWTEIGVQAPDDVKNLDYIHARKIKHRNALKLNPGIFSVSSKEVEAIARKSFYKKGRFIVAGIACALLWFILIGLIVIYAGAELADINIYLAMVLLCAGFVTWIVLSVVSVKECLKLPIRRLMKMRNRSELLLMDIYPSVDMSGFKTLRVQGVAREGDAFIEVDYPVAVGCEALLNEMKRGTILYRYFAKDNAPLDYGSMLVARPDFIQSRTSSSNNS